MSVVQCNVLGCSNSRYDTGYDGNKIRFHWYPLSLALRREWIMRTNPALMNKTMRYILCDQHFEDSQFQTPERRRLNRNAVPNRNLPTILTEDQVVITEEIVESPIEIIKNEEFLHDYAKLIIVKDLPVPKEKLGLRKVVRPNGKYNMKLLKPIVANVNHSLPLKEVIPIKYIEKNNDFTVKTPKRLYERRTRDRKPLVKVQQSNGNRIKVENNGSYSINVLKEDNVNSVTMCHPLTEEQFDEKEDSNYTLFSLLNTEPTDLEKAERTIIEQDSNHNTSHVCRFCVSSNRKLRNIHESTGDLSFYDKFCTTFPDMQLEDTEKYELVCDICYQKLDRAYRFRLMVVSIEDELKTFQILRTPVEKFCENYSNAKRQCEVRLSAKNDARKLRKLLEKQKMEHKIFVANDYSKENETPNFYLPFVAANEKENAVEEAKIMETKQIEESKVLHVEKYPKRKLIKGTNDIYDVVYIDEKGTIISENIIPKIENDNPKIAYSTQSNILDQSNVNDKIIFEFVEPVDLLTKEIQNPVSENPIILEPEPSTKPKKASQKSTIKYSCEKCGSRFASEENFIRHTKDHAIDRYIREYECSVCPQKFPTLKLLTYHKRKHFTSKPIRKYLCGVCNLSFPTHSSLRCHRYGHTKPFQCSFCPKKFSSAKNKSNHESWHKGEKFTCEICSKCFSSIDALKNHVSRHELPKKVNFLCEKCGKGFPTNSDYNTHFSVHTGVKNFKCNTCSKLFRTKNNLKIHMYHHTQERPHKCELCGKGYKIKSLLIDHYNSHYGHKKFQCQICEKKFSNKKSYTIHLRSHTGELPYKCENCSQQFTSRSGLQRHFIRKHTNIRNFKCDICNFAFTFKAELTRHKSRHEGVRRFCCEKCGKGFLDSTTLRNHINSVHENLRPFSCTNCDKKFKQLAHLKTHQLIHTDNRNFRCSECGKTLSNKYHFKQHQLIHAASKPFACKLCRRGFDDEKSMVDHECRVWSCPQCDKCFYNRNTFYCHKKTHNSQPKKVKCEICAKEIKDVYCLKLHMRTHTKEKPFKCDVCLKSFTQSGSLRTHLKLHQKIKNYHCEYCLKSFRQAVHLQTHKNYHFGYRPYSCTQCFKSYFQKRDLTQHMEKIHSVTMEESHSEESNQEILLQIDEFGNSPDQFILQVAESVV